MEHQASYGRRIWSGWGDTCVACGKLRRCFGRAVPFAAAGQMDRPVYLLMDRACEGDETRALAAELGYMPVVPPKSNRKNPWDYDKQLYKQRNQVERLFRRLRRFENDCVCIIAPICQKIFRLESLDQLCCNCAIRCGPRSGKESHRHTMRIHGQMYPGVEPPFVRPIA